MLDEAIQNEAIFIIIILIIIIFIIIILIIIIGMYYHLSFEAKSSNSDDNEIDNLTERFVLGQNYYNQLNFVMITQK